MNISIRNSLLFAGLLLSITAEANYNVHLIAVNNLRPKPSCCSHPMIHHPAIDRHAEEGLLIERSYCQQAVFAPSRIFLMRGICSDTSTSFSMKIPMVSKLPEVMTVTRLFRKNDYVTIFMEELYHHERDDSEGWTVLYQVTTGREYVLPGNVELYLNSDYGDSWKLSSFELDAHMALIFRISGYPHRMKTSSLAEYTDIFPAPAELCSLNIPMTCQCMSLEPFHFNPSYESDEVLLKVFTREVLNGWNEPSVPGNGGM